MTIAQIVLYYTPKKRDRKGQVNTVVWDHYVPNVTKDLLL